MRVSTQPCRPQKPGPLKLRIDRQPALAKEHRMKAWLASRPRSAPILILLITIIAAACKGGGSSGY
jgi:hypothetical protein